MKLRALIGISARHVVELGPALDQPAHQVAHRKRVTSRERSHRREADVTARLGAAVPAGHVIPIEVGYPALDALGRVRELGGVLGPALGAPDIAARDPLERLLEPWRSGGRRRPRRRIAPRASSSGRSRARWRSGRSPPRGSARRRPTSRSRLLSTAANNTVFRICGTIRIVSSSTRRRSVSTSGAMSSSEQTRTQKGM